MNTPIGPPHLTILPDLISPFFPMLPQHRSATTPEIEATGLLWSLLWPPAPVKSSTHVPDSIRETMGLLLIFLRLHRFFLSPCSRARHKITA